jgi:phenylalanyl-tRNA synthetase alpha chain
MDVNKLIDKLHPLERKVLPALSECLIFKEIVEKTELKEVEVMRALQWLENKEIVVLNDETREVVDLGSNGKKYVKIGLPERRFLDAIDNEIMLSDLTNTADVSKEEVNITLGVLRKRAAVLIDKQKRDLKITLTDQGKKLKGKESIEEKFLQKEFPIDVCDLKDEDKFAYTELKKRRDILKIEIIKTKTVVVTKIGKELLTKKIDVDYIEKLTPTILKSGLWKKRKFRQYDVEINVPKIHGGKRHFVNQSIDYIKKVWMDLGFEEMQGNLVQTSFWDLDALFVPQDHPARDEQDTFYIKDPKSGKLPKKFADNVKNTHENGWTTGSKGWSYKWSPEIAKENLLRTHTTVLSAQTISKLKPEDLPAKFFSVKRVYRNETLSWKHLFEFVQVEGIVIDPDANFKHLLGYLKNFFKKLGFEKVRIRPGHFPYTEPSAEVDVWHPEKKMWVELGGSGIFRPEVVKPLLGKAVPVLAWGIGLERSIAEYYNITDIRDLYKNDLKQLREMKTWMK